jgi:hypothetical protein
MPTTHDEQNLRFEFNDDWRVEKLDECQFFRENLMPLQLTKSVDFLGLYGNIAYLVEVKDYRGSRIELKNDEKMHANDTLHLQVARKVKDSVACVIGGACTRREKFWRDCTDKILATGESLRVVFWLEFDLGHRRSYKHPWQRKADLKAEASTRLKQLKQVLSWLTKHVAVVNQEIDPTKLPGTVVQNIARVAPR